MQEVGKALCRFGKGTLQKRHNQTYAEASLQDGNMPVQLLILIIDLAGSRITKETRCHGVSEGVFQLGWVGKTHSKTVSTHGQWSKPDEKDRVIWAPASISLYFLTSDTGGLAASSTYVKIPTPVSLQERIKSSVSRNKRSLLEAAFAEYSVITRDTTKHRWAWKVRSIDHHGYHSEIMS